MAAFRKVLEGPSQAEREQEEKRLRENQEKFLYASLEELAALTAKSRPDMKDFLDDIFNRMSFGETPVVKAKDQSPLREEQYEMMFPELFLY